MGQYLDTKYAEREKECRECPSLTRDEWGYCGVCKMRALDERFPDAFRAWVENLKRLYLWQKAGYSLGSEGLTFAEWDALARITRHYAVKDLQATIPAAAPAPARSAD